MNDEANLKRAARRRLIGAVALTTAVVVLLPLLLDSEPKPTVRNVELHIPSKDMAGEFTPKITPPSVNLPATAAPAPPPPASAPLVSPATPTPQETAAPDAADSRELPKPRLTEQSSSGSQQSFTIQIGAYSKTDAAHNLHKKLIKDGFKAYTEKIADKTRVRVGPFPTREAAEKTLRKLEALSLHPEIITLPQ